MKIKGIRDWLVVFPIAVFFSIVGSMLVSPLAPIIGIFAILVAIGVAFGGFWIVITFWNRRYRK